MTGVGLLSPVGLTTRETWESLLAGRSGAGAITRFDILRVISQNLHSTRR